MKKFALLGAAVLGLCLSTSLGSTAAQAACWGPCRGYQPYVAGGFYIDQPEIIVRHHYRRVPPPPGYYRPQYRPPYYPQRYDFLPRRPYNPAVNYYPGTYQPCW